MRNYTYNRSNPDYSAKIEYYQAQLINAVEDLNIDRINFFTFKLTYFVNRQLAVA